MLHTKRKKEVDFLKTFIKTNNIDINFLEPNYCSIEIINKLNKINAYDDYFKDIMSIIDMLKIKHDKYSNKINHDTNFYKNKKALLDIVLEL